MLDQNRLAEGLVQGLLRYSYDWTQIVNLNQQQRDYPGIDLADFNARVAIQVTGSSSLEKLKTTLETFLKDGRQQDFDRLVVYVLTEKQSSYRQQSLDDIQGQDFNFNASRDVLDYRDILTRATDISPVHLQRLLGSVIAFSRNIPEGLADEDFDPPKAIVESVHLNLALITLPDTLYVADILPEFLKRKQRSKPHYPRNILREHSRATGNIVPSDYHVFKGQILTFHDLQEHNPFSWAIDEGTVTELSPEEFYSADPDQERVFKALLRYSLQTKLYQENVKWIHEMRQFAFMPMHEGDSERIVKWKDKKTVARRVYDRKMNKNDPTKVFQQKHFAFGVDFYLLEGNWYVSLTPDWYFSHGPNFSPSSFGSDNVSWLKRNENNSTVETHFRFLVSWLIQLDTSDLFENRITHHVQVHEPLSLEGHPFLPDQDWLPLRTVTPDLDTVDMFVDG